jgi:16S rRNA (guanine966-N2)-methyltransferase
MSRAPKGCKSRSQLRIIGGQWRGRKLAFTPEPGLRPTTDRVRETLFNWLAPDIHGARCLDLYAGSGALGLEALSRGAARCDFVDTSSASLRQIQLHLNALGTANAGHCRPGSALDFLASNSDTWDIVFVDPPFGADLVEPSCALLNRPGLLAQAALVYVETAKREQPDFPHSWTLHREKQAGEVCYRLFIVDPG